MVSSILVLPFTYLDHRMFDIESMHPAKQGLAVGRSHYYYHPKRGSSRGLTNQARKRDGRQSTNST